MPTVEPIRQMSLSDGDHQWAVVEVGQHEK